MTTTNENNGSQQDNSPEPSSVKDVQEVESSSKGSSVENTKDVEVEAGESISKEGEQVKAGSLDHVEDSSAQESGQTEDTENLALEDKEKALREEEKVLEKSLPELYLNGLYATKLGMSSIYNDQGQIVPVTVLKFDTWRVTQIKTKRRDGYVAIQLGSNPRSERKSNLPQKGHLKLSGFSTNVTFLREIRGEVPPQPSKEEEGDQPISCQLGQVLSIHSLAKGDRVHLSSISKGRGFAGTMKRLGYSGGPASHGSQFHRKPGSIGMCEEPARVLPGKGMPGHHGSRNVTLKHVEVVEVISEKKVLLVKGSVPGGRNSLVKLMKEGV